MLRNAGEEWADKAGGTSGALWGAGLLAAAERLPSDAVPTDADIVAAVVNAWRQVKAIGGAEVGDKTLVDALEPFAVTLQERFDAGDDLETAWDVGVSAAQSAAAATADIAARMGRSRVAGRQEPRLAGSRRHLAGRRHGCARARPDPAARHFARLTH